MTIPSARNLDGADGTRSLLPVVLDDFSRFLAENELSDGRCDDVLAALRARIEDSGDGLRQGGRLEFEQALGSRLMQERRQVAAQAHDLLGLRRKGRARLDVACRRVKAETAEFERCVVQLQAQRAVHIRLFARALDSLAGGGLRAELAPLHPETPGALPDLSARMAFAQMCAGLRGRLAAAQAQGDEIRAMLAASYARLNAEFAFGLSLDPPPALQRFVEQLDQIESGYAGYLGPSHALRRLQPRYMEQLRRMLLYKLRAVFESACGDVERWNKAASEQVDALLAERRCALGRRSEAVERMQRAIGGLEQRIDELAAQDARLRQLLQGVDKRAQELRKHALPDPEAQDALAEG